MADRGLQTAKLNILEAIEQSILDSNIDEAISDRRSTIKDIKNWVYSPVVRERCLRVVFAGDTTGWCWNGILQQVKQYELTCSLLNFCSRLLIV